MNTCCRYNVFYAQISETKRQAIECVHIQTHVENKNNFAQIEICCAHIFICYMHTFYA